MFARVDKCGRIRRLLSDRVDGPLSPRDERRVAAHLAECDECRQEFEFYCELKETASEMEMIRPPAYLWDRIALQVDEHPWGEDQGRPAGFLSPARLWNGNFGLAGAFASLILVVVIGLLPTGRPGDASPPERNAMHEAMLGHGIESLSVFMLAGGDRVPAEVRDYYIRHAESLERQIRTIKSALAQYPNNRQIQARLAIAYEQKLQLYREVETATIAGGIIPGNFVIKFDNEDRRYD